MVSVLHRQQSSKSGSGRSGNGGNSNGGGHSNGKNNQLKVSTKKRWWR
jgi:hypothetical protein